jgi:hypothetical protein
MPLDWPETWVFWESIDLQVNGNICADETLPGGWRKQAQLAMAMAILLWGRKGEPKAVAVAREIHRMQWHSAGKRRNFSSKECCFSQAAPDS